MVPHRRQLRLHSALSAILLVAICGLLAWLSTRYHHTADWTSGGRHTLSEASTASLTRLQGPVEITGYARPDAELRGLIEDLIERFRRIKPDIGLRFVDPDKVPDEVRDLGIQTDGELVIRYAARSEHVEEHTEEALTNALQRVLRGGERFVVFLEGHGERNPVGHANHDLDQFAEQLGKRGIKVQGLNLASHPAIPDNTSVLVIATPEVDYLPREVEIISAYLKRGGNLLWLADPGPLLGLDGAARKGDAVNARLALNLGLIGLVGILVLLAVYEPGLDAPKQLPRLTTIEGPAVKAIMVTRKDGEAIVLAKEGERWMMRAPYSVPANPARVQSILGFLEGTSQASFPAQGHDLKRFGLAEPKVRMEVDADAFAFGDTSPMNGQRYVLYKDQVHLTMDALYDQLLADPGDFVSPRLVEEGRELTAIELPGATVEHRESGWVLRPEDASVKTDALAKLADDWLSAQALAVRKRSDAASQDTVTLELKDAPALRFEVLAREPLLVLARPELGLEYRLDSGMAERLLRPARTEKKDPSAGQEASGDMAPDPPSSDPAAEP